MLQDECDEAPRQILILVLQDVSVTHDFAELVDAAQNAFPRQTVATRVLGSLALVPTLPQELAG